MNSSQLVKKAYLLFLLADFNKKYYAILLRKNINFHLVVKRRKCGNYKLFPLL